MLSPSAAPRWKITTSRLLRMPGSAAPKAARVRKLGSAVVPTTASAPLRKKIRRVMDIRNGSWLLAPGSWLRVKSQKLRASQLSSLKLRRPQYQSRNRRHIGRTLGIIQSPLADRGVFQLLANGIVRLPGKIA